MEMDKEIIKEIKEKVAEKVESILSGYSWNFNNEKTKLENNAKFYKKWCMEAQVRAVAYGKLLKKHVLLEQADKLYKKQIKKNEKNEKGNKKWWDI